MSEMTQAEALERARAAVQAAGDAAEGARQASDTALGYLDQVAGVALQAGEAVGGVAPFVYLFSVFVMAIFVGYYVVWSVTPALHTPLMAVTNAISSVIIVGALLAVGVSLTSGDGAIWAKVFGFIALVLASVNIFGGFMVTSRMLAMYKKKQR
ncbi:proton-translocating transhydrogenase family protein [Roseibium aestuarii]|uniref:proton-translocating NAD(P)(+) transhydrogenase n=1 Tax=Roseibium aestuarii TaxID=2600299 RepID=A0ABW4JZJ7_9HYPH|nr:proton-translocating transhydrogenase family protein [Roseibium aestuarii]